ncbi:uncharacterized protein LOC104418484 [Eucalyptus grandis]|uniref:Probable magnesium transporter n=1 Tax=Eucalyptus globulus TaxID=34317 RepID=A0ABD3L2X8_EUCGL|nr:uncharacterized protein LOC120285868 [Eucalyptus grandis]XP_039166376.1 uncharacterized protein LOC120285868 [Eucalyptus grandis]XP_039174196.1 uncharacterized protein LOC104418484 [Eucalyptus grandis]
MDYGDSTSFSALHRLGNHVGVHPGFHFSPRCGHTDVLVYTGICSLMGSLSVMSVKARGTSLKLTFEGKNQLIYSGDLVLYVGGGYMCSYPNELSQQGLSQDVIQL